MKIEEAVALAASAHASQVDKAGLPYLYHLMRVCNYVRATTSYAWKPRPVYSPRG